MVLTKREESLIKMVRALPPGEAGRVLDWACQLTDLANGRTVDWSALKRRHPTRLAPERYHIKLEVVFDAAKQPFFFCKSRESSEESEHSLPEYLPAAVGVSWLGIDGSRRLIGMARRFFEGDPKIADDERLFRRIPPSWVNWDEHGNTSTSSAAFKRDRLPAAELAACGNASGDSPRRERVRELGGDPAG